MLLRCAQRWAQIHESAVFAERVAEARRAWAATGAWTALEDYDDVLPEDGQANPPAPRRLELAFSARLHPKRELEREVEVANMSMHSSVSLLFFQSMLPWSSLDRSGAAAPLLWGDLARWAWNALKARAFTRWT